MSDAYRIAELEQRVAALEREVSLLHALVGERLGIAGASAGYSPASRADPNSDPEVLGWIRTGEKISAIKRYRELTGLGLAEAKAAVEALMEAQQPSLDPADDPEIQSLVRSGQLIEAIKRYRELSPLVGLKEAKMAIDQLTVDLRPLPR